MNVCPALIFIFSPGFKLNMTCGVLDSVWTLVEKVCGLQLHKLTPEVEC